MSWTAITGGQGGKSTSLRARMCDVRRRTLDGQGCNSISLSYGSKLAGSGCEGWAVVLDGQSCKSISLSYGSKLA